MNRMDFHPDPRNTVSDSAILTENPGALTILTNFRFPDWNIPQSAVAVEYSDWTSAEE